MADTVDALAGLIPVVMTGGILMAFTDKALGMGKTAGWSKISKKDVIDLIGKKRANILRRNPNKAFSFEEGKYIYNSNLKEYFVG